VTYEFIKGNRKEYSVRLMSRMLSISKSSYYDYRKKLNGPMSKLESEREELLSDIRRIFKTSRERYGSPRITEELKKEGIKVSKNRVARIMRANAIAVKTRHKRKYIRQKGLPSTEDLVNRGFNPESQNMIWGSDITYIKTSQGWKYLAVVMDFYSRKIIAWLVNHHQDEELIIRIIENAIHSRRLENKSMEKILIFHSDKGSQYKSLRVKMILESTGIKQSMGGKGSCYDNAVLESFFSTLKKELIYREKYLGIDDLEKSLFDYIEIFYNRKRIHSSLGYLTPFEFENFNGIY
jgi:putative transposase